MTVLMVSPFLLVNPFRANIPRRLHAFRQYWKALKQENPGAKVIPIFGQYFVLYPLKMPENLWFSGIFRGYETETLVRNCLTKPHIFESLY